MTATRTEIGTFLQIITEAGAWRFQPMPDGVNPVYWLGEANLTGAIPRKVELFVGITGNCLTFQMPLVISLYPGCSRAVYGYLARLNREVRLVKYGQDQHGELYLFAELLLETASPTTIGAYLAAFQAYYEEHYREIEALARDPQLARLWESLSGSDALTRPASSLNPD